MNHIDKVFYINLDRREDRRTHIEFLLESYGIPAERFAAIPHEHGLYGCGLSHLAVLKLARDRGYKNVLILEDDILINVDSREDFNARLSTLFEKGLAFDVAMLDVNLQQSEPIEQCDWLIRVKYAHCAGAYIVQGHYYQKLIDLYEWALPKLLETGAHWLYANDAAWGGLQSADQWVSFKDQLCRQMRGYSDTKNMEI
jgi:GR25 family glycosyltransferase involved in LPS biosynthesis